MSTNYYMMTTDKELVKKYFDGEYEIVDDPYLGYKIHIGKRSGGWKPLFEAHENAYDSVSEMLEFITIHPEIHIFNEYGESLSGTQLKEELIDWAENQEKKVIHYSDYIGDIESPIDHVEIDKRDCSWDRLIHVKYWHDKDGYDFTDRPFS